MSLQFCDLKIHQRDSCAEREITCTKCSLPLRFSHVHAHRGECMSEIVKCPNQCSDEFFLSTLPSSSSSSSLVSSSSSSSALLRFGTPGSPFPSVLGVSTLSTDGDRGWCERRHLERHLQSCPLEIIACPGHIHGCTHRTQRRNVQKHVTEDFFSHYGSLVVQYQHLQQEMKTLRKTVLDFVQGSSHSSPSSLSSSSSATLFPSSSSIVPLYLPSSHFSSSVANHCNSSSSSRKDGGGGGGGEDEDAHEEEDDDDVTDDEREPNRRGVKNRNTEPITVLQAGDVLTERMDLPTNEGIRPNLPLQKQIHTTNHKKLDKRKFPALKGISSSSSSALKIKKHKRDDTPHSLLCTLLVGNVPTSPKSVDDSKDDDNNSSGVSSLATCKKTKLRSKPNLSVMFSQKEPEEQEEEEKAGDDFGTEGSLDVGDDEEEKSQVEKKDEDEGEEEEEQQDEEEKGNNSAGGSTYDSSTNGNDPLQNKHSDISVKRDEKPPLEPPSEKKEKKKKKSTSSTTARKGKGFVVKSLLDRRRPGNKGPYNKRRTEEEIASLIRISELRTPLPMDWKMFTTLIEHDKNISDYKHRMVVAVANSDNEWVLGQIKKLYLSLSFSLSLLYVFFFNTNIFCFFFFKKNLVLKRLLPSVFCMEIMA